MDVLIIDCLIVQQIKQSIQHSSKQKATRFETKQIIILSSPKRSLDKKHLINIQTKEHQKSTKYRQRKVQNSVPQPLSCEPRKEEYNILCSITTKSPHPPPPLPLHTHTNKHPYSLPTNPQSPLETVLTSLHRVFKTSLQIRYLQLRYK